MSTPHDKVKQAYSFPFDLHQFQIEAVNELAESGTSGLYLDPGLGKTVVSTFCALYKEKRVLCILPPQLITQWARWLGKVTAGGKPLSVLAYRGSPKARAALNLHKTRVVLMSMQIFKGDNERIVEELICEDIHIVVDEAHCLKDVGTQNYKKFRDFCYGKSYQLLTGTPLNNPLDAYAYIKLISPTIYQSLAQFERVHVAERDFFRNPTKFCNLELLTENLMHNAVRKSKEDVLKDLPAAIITPIEYDLAPAHLKLYKKLAEEQLLRLPDGDKIDATQVQALMHALGQIVLQWHHFAQDESLKSAGYDILEEVLEELGDRKLVVFANYRKTNAEIQRRYNCPGVWGDISPKNKQLAIDTFIDDPKCRLITLMPQSGGVGIDGLQHVCQDVLYLEPPIAVSHFVQSFSRVHREGQKGSVTVRLATAINTIQQYQVKRLSEKEDLIQPLQGSRAVLRAALFGE